MKKILLLSDTHSYLDEKILKYCKSVDEVWHAGDVGDIQIIDKINELKVIAKETVDITGVGFYSLGSVRKNLDENQKIKYSELFESYFLKSFSSRLAEYTNPEIDVFDKKILNDEEFAAAKKKILGE